MRRLLAFCMFCILFLYVGTGCQNETHSEWRQWKEEQGKVKVLSTIGMISDLVKQVGGDHVAVLTLIKGELDPHSYQLVKGDDEKLAVAEIIFYNGLGLEHGPSLSHHLHTSSKSISLGNLLQKKFPERILKYNNQVDPHVWMDISLWTETVPFIVEVLSKRDPEHADIYFRNGNLLMESMKKTHMLVRNSLMEIPESKRFLVTSHDAFNYFTRAYLATEEEQLSGEWQKRFAAPEGLSPESQLSANDIQNILEHVSKYDIQVLFPESNVSKASIRKLLIAGREVGLQLSIAENPLYGDAMGPSPSKTCCSYLEMIEFNAHALRKGLNRDLILSESH